MLLANSEPFGVCLRKTWLPVDFIPIAVSKGLNMEGSVFHFTVLSCLLSPLAYFFVGVSYLSYKNLSPLVARCLINWQLFNMAKVLLRLIKALKQLFSEIS